MAIQWDKFTVKAQQAIQSAQGHAAEFGNPELQPVHLLLALVEDREGVIPAVLEKVGVPTERLMGTPGTLGWPAWAPAATVTLMRIIPLAAVRFPAYSLGCVLSRKGGKVCHPGKAKAARLCFTWNTCPEMKKCSTWNIRTCINVRIIIYA